jgi:hypothetical protein
MGEEVDGRRHRLAALQLHGRTTGFLHDAGRAFKSLFRRALIATERHVDRDQGMQLPRNNGCPMGHIISNVTGTVEGRP